MRLQGQLRVLVTLLAIVLIPLAVWAQAPPPSAPMTPAPSAAPSSDATSAAAGSGAGAIAVFGVIVALLVVVGIGVKLYDLRRKREAEAVHLQAQVSDALLREQSLFGLPITPTARVPTWKGTPAVIEVAGQVPSPEMRDSALRIIRSEAIRIRPDFEIEDRLAVVPTMAARAA